MSGHLQNPGPLGGSPWYPLSRRLEQIFLNPAFSVFLKQIIVLSSDCPPLRDTAAPLDALHKDVQSNSVTRRHTATFPNLWIATQIWVAELFSVGHETIIYTTILHQTCVCVHDCICTVHVVKSLSC